MTTSKNTNANDNSQRKPNTNQSRANVAKGNTSNTSKKSNKQNHNQNQSQPAKQSKQQTSNSPHQKPKTRSPSPQPQVPYEPLQGFNGEEIDTLLSSGDDGTAMAYEPEKPLKQKQSAEKVGVMATGKDFWNELRKQVAMLQRGESTNKGG